MLRVIEYFAKSLKITEDHSKWYQSKAWAPCEPVGGSVNRFADWQQTDIFGIHAIQIWSPSTRRVCRFQLMRIRFFLSSTTTPTERLRVDSDYSDIYRRKSTERLNRSSFWSAVCMHAKFAAPWCPKLASAGPILIYAVSMLGRNAIIYFMDLLYRSSTKSKQVYNDGKEPALFAQMSELFQ